MTGLKITGRFSLEQVSVDISTIKHLSLERVVDPENQFPLFVRSLSKRLDLLYISGYMSKSLIATLATLICSRKISHIIIDSTCVDPVLLGVIGPSVRSLELHRAANDMDALDAVYAFLASERCNLRRFRYSGEPLDVARVIKSFRKTCPIESLYILSEQTNANDTLERAIVNGPPTLTSVRTSWHI